MSSNNQRHYIAVLDPAVRQPEFDSFNNLALLSPLPLSYHLPALFGMDSLKRLPYEPSGIIVFGSAASVYDNLPWQGPMNEWLLPLLKKGIPGFGICYGHQLFAHLFGGKVGFMFTDKTKLRGLRRIYIEKDSLPGKSEAKEGEVVISHQEAVTEVPQCFSIMAHSPEVKVDGMRHKTLPLWSFQSHPESTNAFYESMGFGPLDQNTFKFGHSIIRDFLQFVAKST